MNICISKLGKTGTILAAAVGTLLFGTSDGRIRAGAAFASLRELITESSSDAHLISVAKLQLADADKKILGAEAKVKVFLGRAERLEGEVAKAKDCAKTMRDRLAKLQPVLKGESATFTLAGVNYTLPEVEREARALLGSLDRYEKTIQLKSLQSGEIRRAIAAGETALVAARSEFDAAQGRLAKLELELSTGSAVASIQKATGDMRESLAGGLGSGFQSAMGTLDDRLARLQVANDRATASHGGGTIAWSATEGTSLSSAVEAALGTPSVASK